MRRHLLPAFLGAGMTFAADTSLSPYGAATLRDRLAVLQADPNPSPFGPDLYLQSLDTNDRSRGDVYAVVGHPYAMVSDALGRAENWSHILILHLNIKYCRATGDTPQLLEVGLGRKHDQPLSDAHWLRFAFRPAQATDDYVRVVLSSPSGPMGTRNFLIAVEVAPLGADQTLVHMTYTYTYDTAARLAMKAYLATLGRGKVGFSIVGTETSGQPRYIDGVRGVVERNIMRYYLAIAAFLDTRNLAASEQPRGRIEAWFDATERYSRQLHEVERDKYVQMKINEVQRQETQAPPRH